MTNAMSYEMMSDSLDKAWNFTKILSFEQNQARYREVIKIWETNSRFMACMSAVWVTILTRELNVLPEEVQDGMSAAWVTTLTPNPTLPHQEGGNLLEPLVAELLQLEGKRSPYWWDPLKQITEFVGQAALGKRSPHWWDPLKPWWDPLEPYRREYMRGVLLCFPWLLPTFVPLDL